MNGRLKVFLQILPLQIMILRAGFLNKPLLHRMLRGALLSSLLYLMEMQQIPLM